ncbi:AAA family ATPase [Streptomyces sp. NPDC088116]|uniref:AAA family ATPase n=1 Tax=Streptomyces sp. NPDC088116 TaxID=3365825 RepID=UPI0037F45C2C
MLIERAQEIEAIQRALDRTRHGEGALVAVSGPFGSGRSALLRELGGRTHPSGPVVLRAGGARSESDIPLGVARQLLHGMCPAADAAPASEATERADHVERTDRADHVDRLGRTDRLDRGEGLRLRDVVLGLAATRPLLMLVDDLRWADVPSLRWLALIGEKVAETPIVIVVVAPHPADPAAASPPLRDLLARVTDHVPLGPLSPDGISAMIAHCLDSSHGEHGGHGELDGFHGGFDGSHGEPDGAHGELVRACAEACGGRPLFLAAVLREIRRSRRRPWPGEARTARPASIGGHAVRALAELDPAAHRIAVALAVLGPRTDTSQLFTLAGLSAPDGTTALAALASAGLLADDPAPHFADDPAPRFAHDVIGTAVENSLDAAAGAHWHTKAARALHAAGGPPVDVARHVLAAGNPPDDWEICVLRAAARTHLANSNPALARKYLLQALLGVDHHGPDRAELLVELAGAEWTIAPVSGVRHLVHALPDLPTPADRARRIARLPVLAWESPPGGLGTQLSDTAKALGDPALLDGESRASALALDVRMDFANLGRIRPFTETVRAFRREGRHLDPRTGPDRDRAALLAYAGMLAGTDSATVGELARRAVLAAPPAVDDLHTALPLAARAMLAADLLDEADAWLAAVTVTARLSGGERGTDALTADAERAFALVRRGRHAEAALLAARTLRHADPELASVTGRCCEALALTIANGGSADIAHGPLAQYRALDDSLLAPWLGHAVDGVLASLAGDTAAALEHTLEAGREHELMGWTNPAVLPWRSWAARFQYRLGRPDLAQDLIVREYEQAMAWGAPSVVGRLLRVWAGMTEGEPGVELALRAVEVLDGSADRLETAKAHLLLGLRLFAGDRTAAVERSAGNEPRSKTSDAAHGRVRTNSALASSAAARLTPRERRIAVLVAAGQGNLSIATELGVSVRAVEKHLTNVYRKLGVTGRTQLSELALLADLAGRENESDVAV